MKIMNYELPIMNDYCPIEMGSEKVEREAFASRFVVRLELLHYVLGWSQSETGGQIRHKSAALTLAPLSWNYELF